MSEIEQYTQTDTPAAPPALNSGAISIVREYTAAMDDAHRFASAICQSPFVPEHFRNKPADTALAILYGASVGFDPMTSVQQLFVIGGKPALYARAMVAVVVAAGHEIWTEDEKPGSVTVAGRRKGSDKITRVTWTTELAQQAGYTKNPKYKTDPRSMLYARASGDVARRIAPDALLGLAYNLEEMQLVDDGRQRPAVERSTPTTQKDRVRAAIGAPDPRAPQSEPESITEAQSKKLHALANELHLSREQKIGGIAQIVGHPIESTNDLTKTEAVAVIDSLETKVAATRPVPADEDGAYPADVVDTPTDTSEDKTQVWQQVVAAGGNLDMALWALEADFEQFTGIKVHEGDASAYRAYLTELQGREAA